MERVDGIEPTIPLWKRGVLPLNYTRKGGLTLFEVAADVKPARRVPHNHQSPQDGFSPFLSMHAAWGNLAA